MGRFSPARPLGAARPFIVNLTVPLLVIVPTPYIQVDTIGIDFMANISASSSSVQENTSSENMGGELDAEGRNGWGRFSLSARFKADYSSKKDSKATQESKHAGAAAASLRRDGRTVGSPRRL